MKKSLTTRNKHFRLFRLNYARMFSRIYCNMDVLKRLSLTSDLLVISIRRVTKENLNFV